MSLQIIQKIKRTTDQDIFDSVLLMSCLRDYAHPRQAISNLVKSGYLIRVKNSLYVLSREYARGPIKTDILANIIYGPSYISMEYALHQYGIIPERVYEITSVTTKRNKYYSTPLGNFSYHHLHLNKYVGGFILKDHGNNQTSLFATKEKALVDFLYFKKEATGSLKRLSQVLFDEYRMDDNEIYEMDIELLKEYAEAFPIRNKIFHTLVTLIEKG